MRTFVIIGSALFASAAGVFCLGPSNSHALSKHEFLAAKICRAAESDAHLIQVKDSNVLSDREIAYIYLQANLFEVETAELGMKNATDPEVKAHSAMVAKDHKGVVKQFGMLLEKIGINPLQSDATEVAKKNHAAMIAKLRAKTGDEFDRAFIEHGIKNHTAVINAMKTVILPATKNEALINHFKSVLPAFEHHLSETKKVADKKGITHTD